MPEETIQSVAKDLQATWIADGTKAAEPVTTETPAAEVTPVEQPRGPDGKFVAAGASSATPSPAPVPPATPTPAPATAAQEFIEARLGDSGTFQIPKGVLLPVKRGETIEYEPVDTVLAERMMHRDYSIKTAETAQQRRSVEAMQAKLQADAARVEARDNWLAEREAEMREAQKDPAKWEAYQQMQALYQTNPQFRKTMDDALAKRETDAEIAVYRDREYQDQVREGTELAAGWITQVGAEFPQVNPDRVRQLYAQGLAAGQATLDPAHVRAIYQEEARYLTSSAGPLEKQLAALKAEIDALKSATTATTHNATTQHALERAKAPQVATTGAPPVPVQPGPPSRFGMNELVERNQAWAKQR